MFKYDPEVFALLREREICAACEEEILEALDGARKVDWERRVSTPIVLENAPAFTEVGAIINRLRELLRWLHENPSKVEDAPERLFRESAGLTGEEECGSRFFLESLTSVFG